MRAIAHIAFWLAVIAFLASWVTAAWNIIRLSLAIRRKERPNLASTKLFDTKNPQSAAYPEARWFMRAMAAAALSFCIALATGLGSGILH